MGVLTAAHTYHTIYMECPPPREAMPPCPNNRDHSGDITAEELSSRENSTYFTISHAWSDRCLILFVECP